MGRLASHFIGAGMSVAGLLGLAALTIVAGCGSSQAPATPGGVYVVRAELPDLDPEKDVEVTVDAGVLAIHAERREEREETHRLEFRYGSFTRSVTLPGGADSDKVTASYAKGILEVRVPVGERKTQSHRIAIEQPG